MFVGSEERSVITNLVNEIIIIIITTIIIIIITVIRHQHCSLICVGTRVAD